MLELKFLAFVIVGLVSSSVRSAELFNLYMLKMACCESLWDNLECLTKDA